MKIKILIADDHPIFRKGLTDLLLTEKTFQIVAEASDGVEALALVNSLHPDIAVLDVDMPNLDGLQVCKKLIETGSATRLIILTMHKEEALYNEAMNIGVSGYVLKDNAVSNIIACIKSVAGNQLYISPDIHQFLLKRTQRLSKLTHIEKQLAELTASEKRILKLIAENKSSKEIAELLFVSYKTVENHRSNICRKLALEGNNALLKFVIEHKSIL
jgi:DNA-binding NarL/FixJ family response regulator